ncbi:hypothetical protein CPB85DRAFT_833921 [Mucidula mucida]|nr:hypothetical protein CPB85DRAFT_833921 [Mucidula mucida]
MEFEQHNVYIEQLTKTPGPGTYLEPLSYTLDDSEDIIHLYNLLTAIREYGCGDFLKGAKEAMVQTYAAMADSNRWSEFGKGHDPVFATWLKAEKTKQAKERKGKTLKEAAAEGKNKVADKPPKKAKSVATGRAGPSKPGRSNLGPVDDGEEDSGGEEDSDGEEYSVDDGRDPDFTPPGNASAIPTVISRPALAAGKRSARQ